MKRYNTRSHGPETARQMVGGGALIVALAALAFAALRLGDGALLAALGTLLIVAMMLVLCWWALKVIEWLGGRDDA